MKKNNPPDTIYLQWHGDNVYGDLEIDGPTEVTWCADEIYESDIEYLQATPERKMAGKLLEALEINMRWIGQPPTDPHSYDSTRELAWQLGQEAIASIKKEK